LFPISGLCELFHFLHNLLHEVSEDGEVTDLPLKAHIHDLWDGLLVGVRFNNLNLSAHLTCQNRSFMFTFVFRVRIRRKLFHGFLQSEDALKLVLILGHIYDVGSIFTLLCKMFVKCQEQMRSSSLAIEAILGLITNEGFILALEELRVLHPLDQILLVVPKVNICSSLNALHRCPLLPRFLHALVMRLVDALTSRHQTVVVVANLIDRGCLTLHPGVLSYVSERDATFRVGFQKRRNQVHK